jgi:hypothetical protein
MQELRGWFFLLLSFLFLMLICAIAALSMVMRPQRWCDKAFRATA